MERGPAIVGNGSLWSLDTTGTRVLAVNASTGKLDVDARFAKTPDPQRTRKLLAETDGMALLLDGSELVALQLSTGKRRWNRAIQPGNVAVVAIKGDLSGDVVLGENLGKKPSLERLDVRTGKSRWKISIEAPGDLDALVLGTSLERVYGIGDSGVVAIDPKDGKIEWTVKERIAPDRKLLDVGGDLAVVSGNQIRFFRGVGGKPMVVTVPAAIEEIAANYYTLAATTQSQRSLVIVEAVGRRIRTTVAFKDRMRLLGVRDEAIYMQNVTSGSLVALNQDTGAILWSHDLQDEQLAIHRGRPTITYCDGGHLVALEPR